MYEHIGLIVAGDRVTVADSPIGRGQFPLTENVPLMSADLRVKLEQLIKQPDVAVEGGLSGRTLLQALGTALFGATLGAWGQFRFALDQARDRGNDVRISIVCIDAARGSLPWELMYDPVTSSFVALATRSAVTRSVTAVPTQHPIALDGPLRVLVCSAQPQDQGPLSVESEVAAVVAALQQPEAGNVEVFHVRGTFKSLSQALSEEGPWHVLHFIGHGRFDTALAGGVLLFEDANSQSALVEAARFANLVATQDTLRLVVLSSCQTAAAEGEPQVVSVAETVLRSGRVNAVVTMQFEVTNWAADVFSRSFYSDLVVTGDVDHAVAMARTELWQQQPPPALSPLGLSSFEWCTPVLYREFSGVMFTTPQPSPAKQEELIQKIQASTQPTGDLRRLPDGDWELAAQLLDDPTTCLDRVRGAIDSLGRTKWETGPDGGLIAYLHQAVPVLITAMATEELHVRVQAKPNRSELSVRSHSRQPFAPDVGRNQEFLTRIASDLGITLKKDA